MSKAVIYARTSSLTNTTGDSLDRQVHACSRFAEENEIEILLDGDDDTVFWDKGISGNAFIESRPAFVELLKFCKENDVTMILIENVTRFSRDVGVAEVGYRYLSEKCGIQLIPVDDPTYFVNDENPTQKLIRQLLACIADWEKAMIVAKMAEARDRMKNRKAWHRSKSTKRLVSPGKCQGKKNLAELYPDDFKRMSELISYHRECGASYADISEIMRKEGYRNSKGNPFAPMQIKRIEDLNLKHQQILEENEVEVAC